MIPVSERQKMIGKVDEELSISRQCRLLSIARSTYYDSKAEPTIRDLQLMRILDELYLEDPTRGTRRMSSELKLRGHSCGRDRTRALMSLMRMKVIYCRPRTTVIDRAAYKYPYLLRGVRIVRNDQVWKIDISHIPMATGFMYLVAIIDVHSRYIVGWDISNTMDAKWVVKVVQEAIRTHGRPEILNSDQGSQFTSQEYISYIKDLITVRISMDGKGRAKDNAHIERFFRTIKYEKLYIEIPKNGTHLYALCDEFIRYYNTGRGHSSHNYLRPAQVYLHAA